MDALSDKQVTVTGRAELHLSSPTPLQNSTVTLEGDHSLLVLTALMPSEAAEMLKNVKVGNEAFDSTKHRLSIYGNGCAIPGGSWGTPLTIYKEEQLRGQSMDCRLDTYYRDPKYLGKTSWDIDEQSLGDFDNAIRSFRLRRGYGATFANCGNGHGFSRCFVATDSDLIVPVMPEGLEFASFIRVFRYDWVGKRGISGGDIYPVTRSAWYYTWGASDNSTADCEFVPMRHNKWWDGWDRIASRRNSSCLLGYNEPDHFDQSDLSPDIAIENWDSFTECGLRLGSPAPDNVPDEWLRAFMRTADSLNYRVDFVATHMYWDNTTPDGINQTIRQECRQYYRSRPMWITEWNNGANWTGEWWPDAEGNPRDADFNVTRTDTTVIRPHTEANSAKQCEWLAAMLQAFDDNPYLERHCFYNWVEDARAIELGGKLTPAGKIFADFRSRPGLTDANQYEHTWKIAPPRIEGRKSGKSILLKFYDHNGETADHYIVKHRVDKGDWETIAELYPGTDYKLYGPKTITYTPDVNGRHSFRIKAVSYKGTESQFSRIYTIDYTQAGIDSPLADIEIDTADHRITASRLPAGTWAVHTIDGRTADTLTADHDGNATSRQLSPGIYMLLNHKIVIK